MQVYGSILPGAAVLARLVAKAAGEARERRPLSREAKKRRAAVVCYEAHGHNASLTARHFCLSRSTFHTWLGRHRDGGDRRLEERSRRTARS